MVCIMVLKKLVGGVYKINKMYKGIYFILVMLPLMENNLVIIVVLKVGVRMDALVEFN